MHAKAPAQPDSIHADHARHAPPWRMRVAFWILLAIAMFYLISEHRAHLLLGLSYLPLLLLAACPLMHVFGHGGHGHGHGHGASSQDRTPLPGADDNSDDAQQATIHRHGEQQP